MDDAAGGIAVLAAFVLVLVTPIAMARHRRAPDEVVTAGSAHGHTGMAIHPRLGHPRSIAVAWVVAVGVTVLGVYFIGASAYAAALFIAVGLFLLYLAWSRTSGRSGDGTLILTREGIHQVYAGSEVFVPWDDVRGLVTTPTDFIVETTAPVRPLHHMPAFLSRRSVETADAVSLPRRNLPALPFQEMVELYSTSPAARAELGTDEAIQRARGMLAGAS